MLGAGKTSLKNADRRSSPEEEGRNDANTALSTDPARDTALS